MRTKCSIWYQCYKRTIEVSSVVQKYRGFFFFPPIYKIPCHEHPYRSQCYGSIKNFPRMVLVMTFHMAVNVWIYWEKKNIAIPETVGNLSHQQKLLLADDNWQLQKGLLLAFRLHQSIIISRYNRHSNWFQGYIDCYESSS